MSVICRLDVEEEEQPEADPEVLLDSLAKQRLANKRDYTKKTPVQSKPKVMPVKPQDEETA